MAEQEAFSEASTRSWGEPSKARPLRTHSLQLGTQHLRAVPPVGAQAFKTRACIGHFRFKPSHYKNPSGLTKHSESLGGVLVTILWLQQNT